MDIYIYKLPFWPRRWLLAGITGHRHELFFLKLRYMTYTALCRVLYYSCGLFYHPNILKILHTIKWCAILLLLLLIRTALQILHDVDLSATFLSELCYRYYTTLIWVPHSCQNYVTDITQHRVLSYFCYRYNADVTNERVATLVW